MCGFVSTPAVSGSQEGRLLGATKDFPFHRHPPTLPSSQRSFLSRLKNPTFLPSRTRRTKSVNSRSLATPPSSSQLSSRLRSSWSCSCTLPESRCFVRCCCSSAQEMWQAGHWTRSGVGEPDGRRERQDVGSQEHRVERPARRGPEAEREGRRCSSLSGSRVTSLSRWWGLAGEQVAVGCSGPDLHRVRKVRFAAMRLAAGEEAAGHELGWRSPRALVEIWPDTGVYDMAKCYRWRRCSSSNGLGSKYYVPGTLELFDDVGCLSS
ncbi:hypothetical protein KC357_g257 [Hortaea werneckii]|nr:hypothetical protein KC357_g257 [Hortaea werneckii]